MTHNVVLVTGGCGFIGSYVVDNLIKQNYETHVIDINNTFINNNAKYYNIDINNSLEINNLFKKISPSFCIHLAGILGTTETWNYPMETVNTNINGANNIYDACGKNNCNILTVDVGSRWLSPYTISKTCSAEFALAYANKYNIKCGLLRIFNVYGPRQSTKIIKICPIFIYNALTDKNLEVWGNKNLDLIYVDDVAKAFVNSIKYIDLINKRRDIFIGSGKQLLTSDFANIVINIIKKGKILHCKQRLGEEELESGFMNNNLACELLNWKPEITLDVGLNNTIEYYKNLDIAINYGNF
jgi:UDP-glucose 4-epimerase